MTLPSMSWRPGVTDQLSVVRAFFTVMMGHLLCVGVCEVCLSPYRTRGVVNADIGQEVGAFHWLL